MSRTRASLEPVSLARAPRGHRRLERLRKLDSNHGIRTVQDVYPPEVVEGWGAGLTPALYVQAMESGEAFFVAVGRVDGEPAELGFSTHRVDDAQDGVSVYVRGGSARRSIGTALLRLAESHALANGQPRSRFKPRWRVSPSTRRTGSMRSAAARPRCCRVGPCPASSCGSR
jgi:hypothetical protein